jgi:tRNA-2-methylthio-N6-dimethylallyladenosine synthase
MQEYIQKVKEVVTSKGRQYMAYVHTFGCQLNFSEGEKIKGLLTQMGYGLTDSPENADLIMFNTCAVRENAEDRVFGQIGAIKRFKKLNPDLVIGLSGCMAQEQHVAEKVRQSYPYVDIVFGTSAMDKFPKLLWDVLNGKKHAFDTTEYGDFIDESFNQVRDSEIFASVPIMYGCNNFCTYCIVPYVRGRERSRKSETIIKEVQGLISQGYKEIMLLGQNVNSYGNDLEDEISFPELLRKLNALEGEFVIRFMSSHPKDATTELIDTILQCDKVGKHLHLPVQCGSNDILKAMNRRYTVEKYLEIIDYARSKCEDFSFTTDIIIGFPNESDEDFQGTMELIKRVKYDNIYSFIYSKRSGTKASLIDDKISDETKGKRMRDFLAVQRDITDKSYKRFVGRTLRVLVSGESKTEGVLTGKSSEYIIVEFVGDKSLIGQFVDVKVTQSRNWSVFGELV